jgi:hypothetical protein
MIKGLGAAEWGTMWFDIEDNPSTGCGWSPHDFASNCAFLLAMVQAAAAAGAKSGVYSSHYMWAKIMGDDCMIASALPLWYAAYDGVDRCTDLKPFGGWTHAYVR